jgi:hypothetical protein
MFGSKIRTIHEVLWNTSGQENREYDLGGSVALTTQHPLSAKVGTTSPRSGGHSVGIVRQGTKATEIMEYKYNIRRGEDKIKNVDK